MFHALHQMKGVNRLYSRIAVGVIIPVVFVTLTVYFLMWSHLQDRIENEYRTAESSLNAAHGALSKEMGDSFQRVLAVKELPIVKRFFSSFPSNDTASQHLGRNQSPEQLDLILARFLAYFDRYHRLALIDTAGNELLNVNASKLVDFSPQNHSETDYYLGALELKSHDLYLSMLNLNVEKEEQSSTSVINIATPVLNESGEPLGVLVATLNWQAQVSDLLHLLAGGAKEQFMLVDSDGREFLTGQSGAIPPQAALRAMNGPDAEMPTTSHLYSRVILPDHLMVYRAYELSLHSHEGNLGSIVHHIEKPWQLGVMLPRPTYGTLLLEVPERLAGIAMIYLISVSLGVFWVLSRHRAQALFRKTRQFANEVHDLYENAPCGYHSLNDQGHITRINSTELDWLGRRLDEVMDGLRYRDVVTPETREAFDQHFNEVFIEGKNASVECELLGSDGNVIPVALRATIHSTDTGQRQSRTMVFDLTERKKIEALLVQQALTDPLTGLGNRRQLEKQSELEMARFRRSGEPICLMAIDFDHFKHVNDTHGHDVGDLVLQSFSRTAQELLRVGDILCRTGGEEFIAMFPNTAKDQGLAIAERIRLAVESTPVQISKDSWLHYTVSLGVTVLDASDSSLEPALKRADQAVYGAKEAGRNRVLWKDTNNSFLSH